MQPEIHTSPQPDNLFTDIHRIYQDITDHLNRSAIEARWTPTDWISRIIDTDRLSLRVDTHAWRKIKETTHKFLPETLAGLFPDYGLFHPVSQNHTDQGKPFLYTKDGIPTYRGPIVVGIIAPSASGKDTLLGRLTPDVKKYVARPITSTSRERRKHEQRNAYIFRTKKEMKQLKKENELVEGIRQFGYLYGTEIYQMGRVLNQHRPVVVWRGDIIGVKQMREYCRRFSIPFVCVGVLPGLSYKEMRQRIVNKRGKDASKRWLKAKFEIENLAKVSDFLFVNHPKFDLEGKPDPRTAARHLGSLLLTLIGKEEKASLTPAGFLKTDIIFSP